MAVAPPDLLADVDRNLTGASRGLTFTPAVERYFQAATSRFRLRMLLVVAPTALAFYLIFVVTDWFMIPDVFVTILLVKIFFNLTLVLIAMVGAYIRPSWTDFYIILMFIGGQLTLLLIVATSRTQYTAFFLYAIALIYVVSNTALNIRLVYSACVGVATIAMVALGILFSPVIDWTGGSFAFLTCIGFCAYSFIGSYRLEAGERATFLLALREKLRADALAATNKDLTQLADVDGLTGVHNRRSFDRKIVEALSQAAVKKRPLALLMIDIDDFKRLNDAHGHQAGDTCLQKIASTIQSLLRSDVDYIARYGGEEFAVILGGTSPVETEVIAERVRAVVGALRISLPGQTAPIRVTISIGGKSLVPDAGTAAYELIAASDAALYQAKHSGRNRVVLSP